MAQQRIEYPSRHVTYTTEHFAVFEYDVYPRSSVLAGRERRKWLANFDRLVDAIVAYPNAKRTEEALNAHVELTAR